MSCVSGLLKLLATWLKKINIGMLLNIKQAPDESLRKYIARFNETLMKVVRPSDSEAIMTLIAGLRPTRFLLKITDDPPTTLAETMERAYREMNAEETMGQRMKEVVE